MLNPSSTPAKLSPTASRPAPARVLVVEDEVIVARDIQAQVEELGYVAVGHATSGEEAMVLAAELLPDIVLMDINIVGQIDGIDAALMIREACSIPVIFLTAYASPEILARAKLAEPLGYLLKPFAERELQAVLETALYRAQFEERLRANDAALRSISQGVLVCSTDGIIQFANHAFTKITGYADHEVIGRSPTLLEGPATSWETRRAFAEAMAEGRNFESEILHYRKDGAVFWNGLSLSPVRNARGSLTHLIAVIRDISLQRRERELRRDSEELAAAIIAAVPDAVIVVQTDGTVVEWNPLAEQLFGAKRNQQVGQKFELARHLEPVLAAEPSTEGQRVIGGLRLPLNRPLPATVTGLAGARQPVEVIATSLPRAHGEWFALFLHPAR
jgi:PAS domain S-box-containing protein